MKKIIIFVAMIIVSSVAIVSCGDDTTNGATSTLTITGSGS